MTFSEEILKFADQYGLIHPDQSHSSQNGVLYTAYALALKAYLGELTHGDQESYEKVIKAVSKRPGLLCRVPGPAWGYQEGPDDYIGAICGSQITDNGPGIGARIYAYGFENKLEVGPLRFRYFYNTDCPGTQLNSSGKKNWPAWLGRVLIFRVLVSWGVGFWRRPWERFIFASDCIWTAAFAKQYQTDPLMMLFMKLQAFGSPRLKSVCATLLAMRKVTFKKAFAQYFGPNHPLVTYMPEEPWANLV